MSRLVSESMKSAIKRGNWLIRIEGDHFKLAVLLQLCAENGLVWHESCLSHEEVVSVNANVDLNTDAFISAKSVYAIMQVSQTNKLFVFKNWDVENDNLLQAMHERGFNFIPVVITEQFSENIRSLSPRTEEEKLIEQVVLILLRGSSDRKVQYLSHLGDGSWEDIKSGKETALRLSGTYRIVPK